MDDLFMTQKNNVTIKNHKGQLEGYSYPPQHSIKIIKLAYMQKHSLPYEDIMIKSNDRILLANQLVKDFLPNPIFEVLSIQVEFARQSTQNNQMKAQLKKKETQLEELKQKYEQQSSQSKVQLKLQNRKILDLENQNQTQKSELNDFAEQSRQLQGQLSTLQTQESFLRLVSLNLCSETDQLKQHIQQHDQENYDLQVYQQQLQQQVEVANITIKSLNKVISQMQADHANLQTENNSIRQNLQQLQIQFDRQKSKLQSAQQQINNQDHTQTLSLGLENQVSKLTQENRRLTMENQQLKECMEDQKVIFEKDKEKYTKRISNLIEDKNIQQTEFDSRIQEMETQNYNNLRTIKSSSDKQIKLEKQIIQLKEQKQALVQDTYNLNLKHTSELDSHTIQLNKVKKEQSNQLSQIKDLEEQSEIQMQSYQRLYDDDLRKKSELKLQQESNTQKQIALEKERIQSEYKDRTIDLKEQEISKLVERCNQLEVNLNYQIKEAEQNTMLYRKVLAKEIPAKLITPIYAIQQDLTIFDKLNTVAEQQYEIIEINLSEVKMNSFLNGNLSDLEDAHSKPSLLKNMLKRIVALQECDHGRVFVSRVIQGHDSIQNKFLMDSGFTDIKSAISCAYVNLISEQLYLNFTKLCSENGVPPLRYKFPKQYLIRADGRYSYAIEVIKGKLFEYQGVSDDIDSHFNNAFSQYTYQITKGRFMVTNLKSIKPDGLEHTYYDPVLNSEYGCFGKMDFGIQGIYKARERLRNKDSKQLYGTFEFLVKK